MTQLSGDAYDWVKDIIERSDQIMALSGQYHLKEGDKDVMHVPDGV